MEKKMKHLSRKTELAKIMKVANAQNKVHKVSTDKDKRSGSRSGWRKGRKK